MIALNPETQTTKAPDPAHGIATPETLLSTLRWRYAVKKYDPARKIPEPLWNALEDALILAPSSAGLQPWKFFVIDDPETRARLREASYGQPQITDVARLVVFAASRDYSAADVDRHVARVAEVHGVPVESLEGLRKMALGVAARPADAREVWAARQTYIALGNFLASAAALGVDATPMEGLDAAKYDAILGLEAKGYRALCVAAVGYRSAEDKYAAMAKVRYAKADVIEHV